MEDRGFCCVEGSVLGGDGHEHEGLKRGGILTGTKRDDKRAPIAEEAKAGAGLAGLEAVLGRQGMLVDDVPDQLERYRPKAARERRSVHGTENAGSPATPSVLVIVIPAPSTSTRVVSTPFALTTKPSGCPARLSTSSSAVRTSCKVTGMKSS